MLCQSDTNLSHCLVAWSNFTNGLARIFCRFHRNTVTVTCDVEKMFQTFHINKEDKNYSHILWWRSSDISTEPTDYRNKVDLFGVIVFWIIPGLCEIWMKYFVAQYENEFPESARLINCNFYMDGSLICVESAEKVIKMIRNGQTVCCRERVHLHILISNSREVSESIPADKWATGAQSVALSYGELTDRTILGVKWNINSGTSCTTATFNLQIDLQWDDSDWHTLR